MIAFLRGTLMTIEEDRIWLDVGGVGFEVYLSGASLQKMPPVGKELLIYTYMNVKEDLMQLYGFLTKDELQIFKYVITVSGIGPKGGLSILSVLSPNDLRFAVSAADAKAIAKAPGIGKKTAEKLILELKDKLKLEDVFVSDTEDVTASGQTEETGIMGDAIQALVALGYGNAEAVKAVRKVELSMNMTVEDVLKQALKNMML